MRQASMILLSLGLVVWSLNWTEVLEIPIEMFWMLSLGGIGVLLMYMATSRSEGLLSSGAGLQVLRWLSNG